jgi:hypothetical protein
MPISVKCPNANCGKALKVKDELAGKKVKCPGCATVIAIPSPEEPEVVEAPVEEPSAPAAPAPGLEQATAIPVYVGLGGLGLLAISCFLPWISLFGFNWLGIQSGFFGGILMLLLALAGGAGVAVGAFAQRNLLPLMLLGGILAGTYSFIWFIIFLIKAGSVAGIGIWLGLIASAAASGALTFAALGKPYRLPPFQKEGTVPLLRDHGGLLIAHATGLLLGLVICLALFGVGATKPSGSRDIKIDVKDFKVK